MNQNELRERLYDATEKFFVGATVIWTEQIVTKPKVPYVTLKLGAITRSAFPVEDEEGDRAYQCSTKAEVNLYTKGKPLGDGEGVTANFVNTATADMMEFVNYLESDGMTDFFAEYGISISLLPPVRDLSELQNDSKYRYRSMAEFDITYADNAPGMYAASNMQTIPNASGGGTEELADAEVEPIDYVEITEQTEGGNEDEE